MDQLPSTQLPIPGSIAPYPKESQATPMLKQYQDLKSQHPDCILFFRLGDFYEMFYEDAKVASGILELVLTSRSNGKSEKIPMCGIPYHAVDGYIARLIKSGLKVAICEQVEDPKLAKGIVKREVIRIITSGTFLDETSVESRFLLAIFPAVKSIGIALIDTASGHVQTNQYPDSRKIIELISRLSVYECIFPEKATAVPTLLRHPLIRHKNITASPYPDWAFNLELAKRSLLEHFRVHNLSPFGIDGLLDAICACGALLEYLQAMNHCPLRHVDRISLFSDEEFAYISPAAAHGLELEDLLQAMDETRTPMGRRTLRFWLYHPLKKPESILERQNAVTLLKNHSQIFQSLQSLLNHTPDIEKNLSKLSCGYTSAKDILAIRNTLLKGPLIEDTIAPLVGHNSLFALKDIPDLRQLLEKSINPDVPLSHPEGKTIRPGFHADLDALRNLQEHGRQWLQRFQAEEIKRTGINSLKVGFNQVFGYYIEITKANLDHVPSDYIRKQTLVNGERFITPALKEFEEKILSAEEKILKIENELIKNIQKEILERSVALHELSESLATLDGLSSLTHLAQSPHYVAPTINEETTIDIKDGRHPVVEKSLQGNFVPNDAWLDCNEQHLIILTGPNMAGKSTYIRQTAILVILAQMGSYVPAVSAVIGVADKIFTRIGAHDDIAKGQSTFMVEMNEMADILNNLSGRSLIILDEIGRGTSTFDGLSLAWALAEHLHAAKARTLFATHFHELTALADERSGIKNYNVAVKEWKDEIVFLHKIVPGSTDDSYGIYVAKLAGIPKDVIARSKQILTQLELNSNLKEKLTKGSMEQQLSLFAGKKAPPLEEIKAVIEAMDVNALTPLAALNKLQGLKNLLESRETNN